MGRGPETSIATGDRAPDVAFRRLDGGKVALSEIVSEGPALLAFFKANCPTCQYTLPFLDRLQGGALNLMAVGQDDARTIQEFCRRHELTGTALLQDSSRELYPASDAFGITYVPSIFVVEPDLRVSWSSVGFFRRDLDELSARAGRPIFRDGEKVPEAKSG